MDDGKSMARKEIDPISADCDNVLGFLQDIAVKAPKVADAPFTLQSNNRAGGWFYR